MSYNLLLRRNENETWLQAALRLAKPWGVEAEIQESYDSAIAEGISEAQAAFDACYDWDICELERVDD